MKTQLILLCITLLLSSFVLGQLKTPDCKRVKTGTFYFYPPKSQKEFLIIRDDAVQMEINLQTGDTSFWKTKWQNSCTLTLNFLGRSQPISNEELSFYNAHETVVQILGVTKDYYIFKGRLDNTATSDVTDTLWLKKRIL